MPKPASGYASRLDAALRACAKIVAENGWASAALLAERLGVTDRMARNYLVDLMELGALEYAGGGRYVLSSRARCLLEASEALGEEFSVEAVAAQSLDKPAVLESVLEKVYRIKAKVEELGDREGLRRRFLGLRPPEGFCGDRMVLSARDLEPERVARVVGEACNGQLKNYVFLNAIPLTVAFVGSVAALVELDEVGQVSGLRFFRKPDIKEFRGAQPFDEGLYELTVEYPELLVAGRRIAARLLAARMKLLNLLEVVEGEYADLVVARGSMLPHGFIVSGSAELKRLSDEVRELHDRLLREAGRRGVSLASVVLAPRDYRLYEAVRRVLGFAVRRVSDAAFLSLVLEPWEYTAPMRVAKERGKEVEGWYEFYWKVGRRVIKVEYVTKGDPLAVQEELVRRLAPTMQVGGVPLGIAEARRDLERYLARLMKAFELALKGVGG